jgi:phosphate-selective porin OprO/OprP
MLRKEQYEYTAAGRSEDMNKYFYVLIVVLLSGFSVFGAAEPEPAVYDKIWGIFEFVDNDEAVVLQRLALKGRLQADAIYFDSNVGDHEDGVWRRFRIGGKAVLFHDFVVHAEADIDLNKWGSNASYKGLTDSYVGWYPKTCFSTKLGKQSAGFTLDGATSSTKLLTMERSIIADNIWFSTEYFTGASGFGSTNGWHYKLGGFSSSGDPEFGEFDSGWFTLASLGRDVSENITLRVDYVYNDPDYTGDVGTADLRNVLSLVSHIEKGKAGLWADLSFAGGIASQSDLGGLQLMPFWSFNDTWQVVARYALVHSADGAGAKLGRYPRKNASGLYEDIHDAYLGFNCFLYGHKLKWQSGLEYNYGLNEAVTGADYRGWGASTGIRISW